MIGLGANLGDRLATLRAAASRIAVTIAPVERASRVYETAPVGPAQPDYLNAAVLVRWAGELDALLSELLALEASFGRVRDERWGPRTLDLDILWSDVLTSDREGLRVPHPRLNERAFAKLPLLDVAPDAPYACDDASGVRATEHRLTDSA